MSCTAVAGDFPFTTGTVFVAAFLQPHDIFCVICGGHGGFVDCIGTSLSFSTTHPKSWGFMLGLAMWADLSNDTANDARFTCCSKVFSVGGRRFRSVDITAFKVFQICWSTCWQEAVLTGQTHFVEFQWEHLHHQSLQGHLNTIGWLYYIPSYDNSFDWVLSIRGTQELKARKSGRSRVQCKSPLWDSGFKATKVFSPLTRKDSVLWGVSVAVLGLRPPVIPVISFISPSSSSSSAYNPYNYVH